MRNATNRTTSARPGAMLFLLLAMAGCREHPTLILERDAAAALDAGASDRSTLEASFFRPPSADAVVASCTALVCDTSGGKYCGRVADGCGGLLDCGGCPDGQACGTGAHSHVCVSADPSCRPLSCVFPSGRYCGPIGDGCGGAVDCGACPAGETCGGGAVAGVCGRPPDPACTPVTCAVPGGGQYCGRIGDGCGRALACGDCPGGAACGADGTANVCPGTRPCVNLCPRQVKCPAGATTSVSGTVLAPTPPRFGSPDPIYDAIVSIPNAPVQPFSKGVSCDLCGAPVSGAPLVTAVTGPDGKFVLTNAPAGKDIPLVIQIGRWRRQVVIPRVEPCMDTPLPAELTRLPRNRREGDIPLTAIATGSADALECVLRKIGVDDAEFTDPSGPGRIHLYRSNGANAGPLTPAAGSLTGSLDTLSRYDVAILECEGMEFRKSPADQQNVVKYADRGGRLFLTHYSYTWLFEVPPFMATATWHADHEARPTADNAALTGVIDQTFPKGKAFAEWLQLVKASSAPGEIQIIAPRRDVDAVVAPAQSWITTAAPPTVQHYTFNTPLSAPREKQCGRTLYSDFHVNDIGELSLTFPAECKDEPLTAQEKVLEFMLFDLTSCIRPDETPPQPPAPPLAPNPPAAPPLPPPPSPPEAIQ
jgi:hypothetical protein